MKKSYFVLIAVLMGCLWAASAANAQSTKQTDQVKIVKEGVGFEGLRVGKSTMADIVKKYGKGYELRSFKKYSYSVVYAKLGLAFYMCQSDKRKQIFDMELRAPFQAKTSRGITIGKSTLEDVYKIYGKNKDNTLQYKGVSFYYKKSRGKNLVTVIDIVEGSGIRQCEEK